MTTIPSSAPQPASSRPGREDEANAIAIFDLDGTLTTSDSFVAFLVSYGRRRRKLASLARMPFLIATYLAGGMKDFQLKQKLIGDFFAKDSLEDVAEHADWFCANWLPRNLHSVGNALLQEHLGAGHRVILLSASPEIFVPQVARTMGIEEVVCTRVQQRDGRWVGQLEGKNCKGVEKVNAMQRFLDVESAPPRTFAYGDSKSDLPVLAWVERGALLTRRQLEPVGDSVHADFPAFSSKP